ncbi:uncharacterized protein LOC5504845 [Nematostella vectensis]|uniref:uncharacterized protein LOC5504845 n=1 Tax=Nematostella vectensis TaxID=45351 RepID=UPI0013902B3A|nr:uncharacterized protein LOC5504845 [Nematostella vectensis]XP_032229072.1 uncharacterized protein LOC5504845 [Nematostella vectensis]XP_032229073.1 uncharacterized protein LOC5504845 [Nematostella vectensis]
MQSKRAKNGRVIVLVAAGVIIVGISCLAAGIALMVKYSVKKQSKTSSENGFTTAETKNSRFSSLLQKLQDTHFELYPERIFMKPDLTAAEAKKRFRSYDPTPSRLKYVTDTSRALLKEFENFDPSSSELSLRERRAYEQAKFWLKHVYPHGIPFGYDYYVGDWLLGPDVFCWMPICYVLEFFEFTMKNLKPNNLGEMELFLEKLREINKTFSQYESNLKLGIKTGMVRNVEGCESGYNGFRYKTEYLSIALYGPEGVFNSTVFEAISKLNFFANLSQEEREAWRVKHNKSMNESLREHFLEHVGKPIDRVLRYLETDHIQYCVSDDLMHGFGNLPLTHVYRNGTQGARTTQRLPSGELIDGKASYDKILSYFISGDTPANDIHKLGEELIGGFYDEILEVAREFSGETDNEKARVALMNRTRQNDMYFSDGALPEIESNERAHRLCSTKEAARIHCPLRWEAILKWFTYTRQIMAELDAKTVDQFHFSGRKHSTPNCPVKLDVDFNPSVAAQGYTPSDEICSHAAVYTIPFFLKKAGPRFEEWTVSAHETRPGHHLQAQGYKERFRPGEKGVIRWLSDFIYFLGFQEGWALYAENPLIANETDTYKGRPLLKYGMLKWQLWQAIRLILDTGFHSMNMTRQEARKLINKYTWDTTDIPDKEITRYQSLPGQAATYLMGKLHIMRLRKRAESRLGDKFNKKDFHFQILKDGPAPFGFLEKTIDLYIECVLKPERKGCRDVLSVPTFEDNIDDTNNMDVLSMRKLHFMHRR